MRVESRKSVGDIPDVIISRLPQYLRILNSLVDAGVGLISSNDLAKRLGTSSAQVRRDLSYLGRLGIRGKGYRVSYLARELLQILGLDRTWSLCLVGVGRLGRAVLNYPGFASEGFQILAAFDSDRRVTRETIKGFRVQPMAEMDNTIADLKIKIAIVAVPSEAAQDVITRLVKCGIKAILNYTPINPLATLAYLGSAPLFLLVLSAIAQVVGQQS